MHSLYFTRHGETVWNVENKICGMTDSPLTAHGSSRRGSCASLSGTAGCTLTRFCTLPSPAPPTPQRPLLPLPACPPGRSPGLREQCFGRYEGAPPRDGAEFKISKTHFADRYSGGESMLQLAQRIYDLLDELKSRRGQDLPSRRPQRHRPRRALLLLRYDQ